MKIWIKQFRVLSWIFLGVGRIVYWGQIVIVVRVCGLDRLFVVRDCWFLYSHASFRLFGCFVYVYTSFFFFNILTLTKKNQISQSKKMLSSRVNSYVFKCVSLPQAKCLNISITTVHSCPFLSISLSTPPHTHTFSIPHLPCPSPSPNSLSLSLS